MNNLLDYDSDDEKSSKTVFSNTYVNNNSLIINPSVYPTKNIDNNQVNNDKSKDVNVIDDTNRSLITIDTAALLKNNVFSNKNKSYVVNETLIDSYMFDTNYISYQTKGYAVNDLNNQIIGDNDAYNNDNFKKRKIDKQIENISDNKLDRQLVKSLDNDIVKDIEKYLDEELDGPWMPVAEKKPFILANIIEDVSTNADTDVDNKTITKKDTKSTSNITSISVSKEVLVDPTVHIVEPDEEDEKWEKVNERKASFSLPPRPPRGSLPSPATSIFHGTSLVDYQGRSWCAIPSGIHTNNVKNRDLDSIECYLPKKCIKKFIGHNKGVQVVEFFPNSGHLLLSASLDGKLKIWDVLDDRQVKRTYLGHTEAIRHAGFNNDGSNIISTGFDRYIRLWDVETGQATSTFSNRKMSYQVKFHPVDSNSFLAPSSDNRIYQWDIRTGNVSQIYNHHLQAVNAVVYFDNGRKFLSSSDDKKLLVWEYDIPVPIKYIQDPEMFSIPYLSLHPSGDFIMGQSMDNTITTYKCNDVTVRPNNKKTFRGHNNSGYACQVSCSPNGKYLISGDGFGKLYVWDWKSNFLTRKLQAHDNGPCMGAIWHPLQPSWVVTCGWDGVVKLWD